MKCLEPQSTNILRHRRPALAHTRAQKAYEALAECRLCAHACGVNRLSEERGFCHAGAETRFFSAQTEVGDELELLPTFAIAFSGCDLRCDFCISGAESWNAKAGRLFDSQHTAARAERALQNGARTIQLLGGEPTIHLPAALAFVAALPAEATLVWKTNAHASVSARDLLDGMFDIWVADFKFGNDGCAERLARVPNYLPVTRENILWAASHAKLIIRHLLMPGHLDCCWRPIAQWLAKDLPGVRVSLRDGFWPAWHASRHAELRRTVSEGESARAFAIAREMELELVP